MRKKKPRILFSQSIIWGFCAFISLIVSCALPAAPDGGPRDTTPPKIIFSSVENNSTNVLTNELKWTFDEYVVLQSPSRNIFSSPPLPENTKYEIRGKSLIISWDNDLLSSSTYVIQMGAAIKDLHEGNVLKGIQWVFSTGSSLDSGKIIGQIIDSWSNSPAKDIAVCLYPDQGSNDSVIFKPALYSSRTDDSGFYKLEYIVRDKAYKIRAFKDTDGNNRLSVGELTPIAFVDGVKADKMNSKKNSDKKFYNLSLLNSEVLTDSIIQWTPWGADSSGELTIKYSIGCDSILTHQNFTPIVIQLKGEKGIYAEWFCPTTCDSNIVTLAGLPPGTYNLQAFYDKNQDSILSSGSYWDRIRPESRVFAKSELDIKANWSTETKWEIDNIDPQEIKSFNHK